MKGRRRDTWRREETHRVVNVKLLQCAGLVVTPKLVKTRQWPLLMHEM